MILKASEKDISGKLVTVQTSLFSSSETDSSVSYLLGAHPLNKIMPNYFLIKKKLVSLNANFHLSKKRNLNPNRVTTDV